MERSLFRDETVAARRPAWLGTARLATPFSIQARTCVALGIAAAVVMSLQALPPTLSRTRAANPGRQPPIGALRMKSLCLPRIGIALAFAMAVPGSLQAKQAPAPADGEQAIAYVLQNDIVLSRLFGDCPALKFARTGADGAKSFLIEGNCNIKNNPEEDADCAAYHVRATGTIDAPSHWTVRRQELTLVCSSEGAATTRRR